MRTSRQFSSISIGSFGNRLAAAGDLFHAGVNSKGDVKQAHQSNPASIEEGRDAETSAISPKCAESEAKFTYEVEANIYGLVAMPEQSNQASTYLLLLLVYVLATSILSIIWIGVWDEVSASPEDWRKLCTEKGGLWDCRPSAHAILMDFSSLDSDADGVWSVTEARNEKMLQQFNAIHDIVLETPELLSVLVPPKKSQLAIYCAMWIGNQHAMAMLDDQELMAMLVASGARLSTIEDVKPQCEAAKNHSSCYWTEVCGSILDGKANLASSQGSSSRSQYFELTSRESVLPKSLHRELMLNLLQPCRLVDPLLCGNAEASGWLVRVPQWTGLMPDKRIKRCYDLLHDTCPRLFGSTYAGYSVTRDGICGERHFTSVAVPVTPALPSVVPEEGVDCEDSDSLLQKYVNRYIQANPAFGYLFKNVEKHLGLAEDSLQFQMTCQLGAMAGFCEERGEMQDPDEPSKEIRGATLFGRSCPRSCCNSGAFSCPSQCAPQPDKGSALDVTCVGTSCKDIIVEKDMISQHIVLKRDGYKQAETTKFIVASELALRVQFVSMSLAPEAKHDRQDPFCAEDYLRIGGVRYCGSHRPKQVDVPRRVGGITEVEWASAHNCSSCYWEVLISDAGEPDSISVSQMTFELQERFHDPKKGVLSIFFKIFFLVILIIWLGYMTGEMDKLVDYLRFIMYCPNFPGSNLKRKMVLAFAWLPRAAILLFVLVLGCFLILVTDSLMDIVLNSVALAFLLDVDEYVYQWTVTPKTKNELEQQEPYQWPCQSRCDALPTSWGMCVRVCLLAFTAIFVVVLQYLRSNGFVNHAKAVDCLCGLSGSHCYDSVF